MQLSYKASKICFLKVSFMSSVIPRCLVESMRATGIPLKTKGDVELFYIC